MKFKICFNILIKIIDMIGMLNRVDGCVYMLFHVGIECVHVFVYVLNLAI